MSVDEGGVSPQEALTRWLRFLPHGILTVATSLVGAAVAVVMGVMVVLTGRRPERLLAFQVLAVRGRLRTFGYFFLLRHDRLRVPTLDPRHDDDAFVEVRVQPAASVGRFEPFKRLALVLPTLVVGIPIGAALDLSYPLVVVVAATRGRVPATYARLLVAVEEWVGHTFLYLYLASDDRPSLVPQLSTADEVSPALAA